MKDIIKCRFLFKFIEDYIEQTVSALVRELKENGYFEMLEDNEFRYEKSVVESDEDWLIFTVDIEEEKVKLINR